ncbi:PorT family protein [Tenacibaculum sp. 190524A02b]|uniref:PorT family protein n=1 Tax=Tenacibaculum vairaonense TaxID=3137860 RepID=A0ABP1FC90_9FLAO
MKKSLFIFIILVSTFSIYSQRKGDFEFGAGIGINYISSSATIELLNSNTQLQSISILPKASLNISVSGEYYFSKELGLKSKLIYDSKSWEFKLNNVHYFDLKLNQITLPILLNWHFGKHKNWYLNFGPYVDFLINEKEKNINTTLGQQLIINDSNEEIDSFESFNSFNIGIISGFGYQFYINPKTKLYIEYEGKFGFSEIAKNDLLDIFSNIRHSFNLGVLFKL